MEANVGHVVCPDAALLAAFLDGRGDHDLTNHVAQCVKCAEVMEGLLEAKVVDTAATTKAEFKKYLAEPQYSNLRARSKNWPKDFCKAELAGGTDKFGRYQVRRFLGRGTFGDVYAAFDPLLRIEVALKLSRTGLFATESSREQFLAEARHAAKLDHPGLVAVRNVDFDDNRTMIVMKLIDGGTLADRLSRSAMDVVSSVRIMIQIARAAHHAHEAGLVHRDLKPSNILLDQNENPVIADFGLVVEQHSEDHLNPSAGRAGTLPYMSPEQYSEPPAVIDRRSDVWAMGVILVEMLQRQRPFPQRDRRALKNAIIAEEPTIAFDSVPAGLLVITKRCLAKNAADRFANADILANELTKWLQRHSPTGVHRWRYGWRRNSLIALSLIVLVGLISVGQWQARRTQIVQRVRELQSAPVNQIPRLVSELRKLSADPKFLKALSVTDDKEIEFRVNVAIAACGGDSSVVRADLVNFLESASPGEISPALIALRDTPSNSLLLVEVMNRLRATLSHEPFLRLTAVAAGLAPDDPVWKETSARIASELCSAPEQEFEQWLKLFMPIGEKHLREALISQMTTVQNSREIQIRSAKALSFFLANEAEIVKLAELEEMRSFLVDFLESAPPDELGATVIALRGTPSIPLLFDEVMNRLRATLSREPFLRLTAVVAGLSPDSPFWKETSARIASELCSAPEQEFEQWLKLFMPIGEKHLREALISQMTTDHGSREIQIRSAKALSFFLANEVDQLAEVVKLAESDEMRPLVNALKANPDSARVALRKVHTSLTKTKRELPCNDEEGPTIQDIQTARVAIALWQLDDDFAVLEGLRDDPDPTLQRLVTFGLAEQEIEVQSIVDQINRIRNEYGQDAVAVKFGLLQVLALLPHEKLQQDIDLEQWLDKIWKSDPDSGIHAMCSLLKSRLGTNSSQSTPCEDEEHCGWYSAHFDDWCMEFAIVEPSEFRAGKSAGANDTVGSESWISHQRNIPRRYAIGLREVTFAQIRKFDSAFGLTKKGVPVAPDDAAAVYVQEEVAYAFCNWCSEQKKLETCYELNTIADGSQVLAPRKDFLTRNGFRLPTEGEWECACRAGTATSRFFGRLPAAVPPIPGGNAPRPNPVALQLLSKYGWTRESLDIEEFNGALVSQSVGKLLPNRWGLFDTYGNVRELCSRGRAAEPNESQVIDDVYETPRSYLRRGILRTAIRGACCSDSGYYFSHSHTRNEHLPRDPSCGIRLARTMINTSGACPE